MIEACPRIHVHQYSHVCRILNLQNHQRKEAVYFPQLKKIPSCSFVGTLAVFQKSKMGKYLFLVYPLMA